MRWVIPIFVLLAMLVEFCGADTQQIADKQSVTEVQVKAAYLYKFGDYVEWPDRSGANPDSPFTIGVIGDDILADELAQMVVDRKINGRPVMVSKLRRQDWDDDLSVLFIGHSSSKRLAEILAAFKGRPVLTVTDSEEAFALGSMINFVVVDRKVRFQIAPKAAGLNNLHISARLLSTAYVTTR